MDMFSRERNAARAEAFFLPLLLASALLIFAGSAEAVPQTGLIAPAFSTTTVAEPADHALPGGARILTVKERTLGQLQVYDERGVGDNQIVRGKKENYTRPIHMLPRPNPYLDLFIALDLGALAALIAFVFASRSKRVNS